MSGVNVIRHSNVAIEVRASATSAQCAAREILRFAGMTSPPRTIVISGQRSLAYRLARALHAHPEHPLLVIREADTGRFAVFGAHIAGRKPGSFMDAAELGF